MCSPCGKWCGSSSKIKNPFILQSKRKCPKRHLCAHVCSPGVAAGWGTETARGRPRVRPHRLLAPPPLAADRFPALRHLCRWGAGPAGPGQLFAPKARASSCLGPPRPLPHPPCLYSSPCALQCLPQGPTSVGPLATRTGLLPSDSQDTQERSARPLPSLFPLPGHTPPRCGMGAHPHSSFSTQTPPCE